MIVLTPLQKLPKNVRDLGKLIVANGFKNVPKVQKIAQSGHTVCHGGLHLAQEELHRADIHIPTL